MISPMMSTVALLLCLVPQGRAQLTEHFVAANPGVSIIEREGRIARVYGGAFSQGATAVHSADVCIETHGGNGFTEEYGFLDMYNGARLLKTAPVSREMILNFVSEWDLGLPKSY